MPAINFPEQPGLQTPENTFSPVSVPESSKNGITYTYDNGVWSVAPIEIGGGTGDGNASIITSDYPPNNPPPKDGDLWWNTSNNTLYIYYVDEDTSQWVVSTPNDNNGGAQIDVGEEPPSSPTDGALWWNTDDNTLYIYYDEGDGGTSQWVIASPGGSGGSGGVGGSLEIPASDEPPTLPSEGDLWWSTTDNTLYIYYRDEDTEQWVVTVPSAGVGTLQQVTDAGNNTTNDIIVGSTDYTSTTEESAYIGTGSIQVNNVGDPKNRVFIGKYQGTLNTELFADGTATFAGYVSAGSGSTFYGVVGVNGGGDASDYAAFYGACLDPSGRVFVGSDVSSGSNNITSKIYANGSATFAGQIDITGQGGFTGYGWAIANNGGLSNKTPGGPTVTITNDGNATFAGNITAGDYPGPSAYMSASRLFANANPKTATPQNSGVAVYQDNANNGAVICRNTAGDGNIVLNGAYGTGTFTGDVSAPNVNIKLEPDNNANYTTTTDSEGVETRVYNGPTLDVKDRLTKTQDALTALKAAAQDNATDLAGLKAAIVAALSDI